MKRIISLCLVLLLLGGLLVPTVAAAGSVSLSSSATSVTVGQNVTVTVKYNGGGATIGGVIGTFKYNTSVFTYVSASGTSGMEASGNAGVVRYVYAASGATAPKEVSLTVTLKANAAGQDTFGVATEEFVNDADYSSLGTPSKTLSVSVSNPSKSGDATLAYLRPSKGTLNPKFDKNVTQYTVSVPYTVTRGLLNFTATDPNAKTEVTDNADLKVGKNTRIITVTAPNGTTKKYTVVITREAEQNTTTGGTGTTTAPPVVGAPEVEVNGVLMNLSVNQPPVNPPAGFVWDFITVGDNEVAAARQENGALVLVYLIPKEGDTTPAPYIYDAAQDSFTPFRQITAPAGTYVLHDLPQSETAPLGTVVGSATIGEQEVAAYVYEDPTLADYAIVYLTAPNGESGLYTYDKVQGTLQRYHTVTVEKEVTVEPEPQMEKHPIIAFIEANAQIILIGAAAVAALAILIVVIVWIASHAGSKKGKH